MLVVVHSSSDHLLSEASHSPAQRHQSFHFKTDRDIVAWVSFGRVGSTMMRQVLSERAEKHGWQQHSGPQGLCHAKSLEFTHGQGVTRPALQQPPCADVEAGAVVQTDFGYCALLGLSRPCRYMTLLRDPIAMIISAYNWFCVNCHEGGIQCPNNETIRAERQKQQQETPRAYPELSCPNMSIVQYARHYSNPFTRQFSGKRAFCARNGVPQDASMLKECSVHLTDVDYQAAARVVADEQTLVLRLESMWLGNSTANYSGMRRLAHFLQEPDLLKHTPVIRNAHSHDYKPTQEELQELRRIQRFDLRLYEEVEFQEQSDVLREGRGMIDMG